MHKKNVAKQSLDDIASAVIDKLRGKVIIHRYDAYSSDSIYLKFDYGVANSLRISDHDGKKYLKYRYNIITTMSDRSSKKECRRGGFQMIFYSPAMINACCRDILAAKAEKTQKYNSYDAVVNAAKEKSVGQRGFWSGAKMVSRQEGG